MRRARRLVHGILVTAVLGLTATGCVFGHPHPVNEVYEVRDPVTNASVIQFATWTWPKRDGSGRERLYLPRVRFRDATGTIWEVENWSGVFQKQRPAQWVEYRIIRPILPSPSSQPNDATPRFPSVSVSDKEKPESGRLVSFFGEHGLEWEVFVRGVEPDEWSVFRVAPDRTRTPVPIRKVYSGGPHPWHPGYPSYPWPVFEQSK